MMHGYLAFDENDELLVPFRTWRNTITGEASEKLSELFQYHIPQRWSIAHLYQAILNGEDHVGKVRFFTTLAGYIHWQLTGRRVIGSGDAAGMFPINIEAKDYDSRMLDQFDELVADKGFPWKIRELLPKVLLAGEDAGCMTEEGVKLLDPSGNLAAGIPMCPPEGDAVAEIDKDAKENFRTRSQQINMILTEYYKTRIRRKEIMAFGDGDNDIAMLREAGGIYQRRGVSRNSAYCGARFSD